MARMSREFQLVLLGAGLLTAGSFLWPDPDPIEFADSKAHEPETQSGTRRGRIGHVIFIRSPLAPSRTVVRSNFAGASSIRGGFGGGGARFSAGG